MKTKFLQIKISKQHSTGTLPETNIAPESLRLEDEVTFGKASWQVLC